MIAGNKTPNPPQYKYLSILDAEIVPDPAARITRETSLLHNLIAKITQQSYSGCYPYGIRRCNCTANGHPSSSNLRHDTREEEGGWTSDEPLGMALSIFETSTSSWAEHQRFLYFYIETSIIGA